MAQQDVRIKLIMDGAQGVTAVTGAFNGLEQGITRSAKAAESLTSHVARMGHIAVTAFSFGKIAQVADTFTALNAQLKIATGSAEAGARAYQNVLNIATRTGQSLEQVATVYRRFAENAAEAGIAMQDVARYSETVAKAVALSGGSAASAEAALTQFGQAIASGVLRGEELNSVMEQTPALARALADGMGMSIGQFREAAKEGTVTVQQILSALDNMSGDIDARFEQMPVTIARAVENLKTAFTDLVGDIGESSGAIGAAASTIDAFARHLDDVASVGFVALALASGKAALSVSAFAASLLAGQKQAAASVLATTKAIDAQTAALYANATASRAASVASRAVSGAIGLLGGPVGALITTLSLGAIAWQQWASNTEQAAEQARASVKSAVDSMIRDLGRLPSMDKQQYAQSVQSGEDAVSQARAEVEALQRRAEQLRASAGQGRISGLRGSEIAAIKSEVADVERQITQAQSRLSAAEHGLRVLRSKAADVGSALKQGIDEALASPADKAQAAFYAKVAPVVESIKKLRELGRNDEADDATAKLNQFTAAYIKTTQAAKDAAREQSAAAAAAARAAREQEASVQKAAREVTQKAQSVARAAESEAQSAARQSQSLREQLETLGMNRAELARYNAAKLQAAASAQEQAAAEAEAALAMLTGKKAAKEQVDALRQTIAARRDAARELREQAKLTVDISVKEAAQEQARAASDAARESARAAEEDWRQTAQSIQTSITDALMRGFENGKGFARNLRDTIKNLFNSLVLRPVVSATVGALIPGSVMAAGTQALGGGGNLLSTASSLWSAFSGSLVSAASNGIAAIGSAIGSNALATFAGGMNMNLLGSVGASTASAIGGATAAGSAFATALPFIGGALAIAAPLIGKLFGGKPSNKAAWGSVELASGRTYDVGNMSGEKQASQETLNARDAFVQSVSTVAQQLRELGGEFDQLANIRIDIGERDGIQADFGAGLERLGADAEHALNEITARMVNDVKGSLPSAMREIVDSMSGDYTRLIDVLDIAKNGIVSIETPLSSLARMSGSIATALTEAGAPMASTVYQMNDLGRTLDLTTEEGRRAALALREVAPAMQQMEAAVQQMTGITAEAIANTLRDVIQSASSAQEAQRMAAERAQTMLYDGLMNIILQSVSQSIYQSVVTPLVNTATQMATIGTAGANIAAASLQSGAAAAASSVAAGGVAAATNVAAGGLAAANVMANGGAAAANTMASGGAVASNNLASGTSAAANNMASGGEAGGRNVATGGKAAANMMVEAARMQAEVLVQQMTFAAQKGEIPWNSVHGPVQYLRDNIHLLDMAIQQYNKPGSMDDVVAHVRTMAEVMKNPDFRAAVQEMSAVMGVAAGELFDVRATYTPTSFSPSGSSGGTSGSADPKNNWDAAFRALERAANAQKEAARAQLEAAGKIAEISRENAASLRRVSEAVQQQEEARALAYVQSARAQALATGTLPDVEKYREAVKTLVDANREKTHLSAFARDREALRLAAVLEDIAAVAEPQQTAAEQQIERLDNLVSTAREQLEALRGNATATLTLAQAVQYWRQETGKALPGYAAGGYTGAGGVFAPAGIVHKGEVVFSQRDIRRLGGVETVERIRRGLPGYAQGGVVGIPWQPAANSADARLHEELAALRAQVAAMDEKLHALSAIAETSQRTARILDRTTRGGTAMVTVSEAAA